MQCIYPIFAKPVLDIFAVCSLAPRINLFPYTAGLFIPKNQNYLLGNADLGFFLSCRLRTTIKITKFSTFYIQSRPRGYSLSSQTCTINIVPLIFKAVGHSGEKSPSKDMEKVFFQLLNLPSVFVLENPTH